MLTSVDPDVIRVLGDPLRLKIVTLLARETLCMTHLVEETGAKQTNLSNHMKVLREAGLVETEPCGRFTYFKLKPGGPGRAVRAVRRTRRLRPYRCREQEGLPVTSTEPTTASAPAGGGDDSIVKKLSTLDRYLAVWILLAMAVGLGLGRLIPGMNDALAKIEIGGISLPIALGLLVMMYPVLAKVRYDKLDRVTSDRKLLISSLVINWIVGPAVMFALAWIFLPDLPEYRTGLIIVGLARCIAMVIIWNDLACGDREAAAVLVALNSVFQVLAFGLLGWFYLDLLPRWMNLGDGQGLDVSVWHIALNVVIFLGIPLLAGFLTRRVGEQKMGRDRL